MEVPGGGLASFAGYASFENAFVTDIGPAKTYQTVYVTSDHPAGTVTTGSTDSTTAPATSDTESPVDPLLLLGFLIAGILILNF